MIPLVAPCVTAVDRNWIANAAWNGMLETEEHVAAFEEEFAEFVGAKAAVAVNSGTNALVLALKASGFRRGDHVTVPTYSCVALRNAVRATTGMEPELADLRFSVAEAMFEADGPVTVMAHMFGTEAVAPSAINDITLSLGAVKGRRLMVCSTFRDKMITTGRGGLIAGDVETIGRCRELAYYETAKHGRGYSMGMTAMQAALGRSQLRQLPQFIRRRRDIAAFYTDKLQPAGVVCPSNAFSVYFRYIVAVENAAATVSALAERGIEAGRGVNPPLHRTLGLTGFPGAESALSRFVSLPCHPSLTDIEVEHVAASTLEVCA